MTKKATNKSAVTSLENSYKLSIQIGLNGLSFCILRTDTHAITLSKTIPFEKEKNPYELLKELKSQFSAHELATFNFSEVVAIHRNNLFSLVPTALFNADDLANYLKFNAKILANDLIVYDELVTHKMVNVYVPFVNINNFIYDFFGAFEYKHISTVMVEYLLGLQNVGDDPICYVHVLGGDMDITVIHHKKLVLYNNFVIETQEDFMYYLLFTLEQLELDPDIIKVHLMGSITTEDNYYKLCQKYIKNVAVFYPSSDTIDGIDDEQIIDFTVLNAL